jgi:mannose-6-phosphate isomerase
MQRIFRLKGVIQPYAWGGNDFIPALTGEKNAEGKPAAEYWLGAHPAAPSTILVNEVPASLEEMIRENAGYFLGKNPPNFGALPFLFKVLDVKQMLSIQVHPTQTGAEEGFRREEQASIPLNASHRNYKDRNGKAEMMIALSDFWLLHGFRKDLDNFFSIPEFSFLRTYFETGGYRLLYAALMNMEQTAVNDLLKPLAERVMLLFNQDKLEKDDPDFWAARALQTYFDGGEMDRGIFSIYLLNLVHLKKGEGIYQHPGMLHAYLEGQNLEVMTNSDNVLRAGLTNKHIDVDELLRHVEYKAVVPEILRADSGDHVYKVPAPEFQLNYVGKNETKQLQSSSASIVLVTEGSIQLVAGEEFVRLSKGQAAFLVAGTDARAEPVDNPEYFIVSSPENTA